MRKLRVFDNVRYYLALFSDNSYKLMLRILVALSFISLFATFGFIVYHLFIDFCYPRVIAGALALLIFIHLNKSVQ